LRKPTLRPSCFSRKEECTDAEAEIIFATDLTLEEKIAGLQVLRRGTLSEKQAALQVLRRGSRMN
jgi:hypothetical protein